MKLVRYINNQILLRFIIFISLSPDSSDSLLLLLPLHLKLHSLSPSKMTKATVELDFLGLVNNQTNNVPKPKFQKFLHRRPSFREIQGAISKIDPEIIKSLLASGGNHSDTSTRSLSLPSSPRIDQPQIPISPVHAPLARTSKEVVFGTVPMTIFYNGTVSVFEVSRNKAEEIMKVALETPLKKEETDLSVISPPTLRLKLFAQNLEGDLPIARRKSLQSFLEKRKERLVSSSPY